MYQPPQRTGKRKGKIAAYYTGRYFRNKLRRILRRNGHSAATRWVEQHDCEGVLRKLLD